MDYIGDREKKPLRNDEREKGVYVPTVKEMSIEH